MIFTKDLFYDLREQDVFEQDCIVFEIAGQDGDSLYARWERDANRFQVAAALERLALALRRTEI